MKNFPLLVEAELSKARAKFPNMQSAHEAFAVILEEVEEFKAEVFKKKNQRSKLAMVEELVQIAAMAQRAAEDAIEGFQVETDQAVRS